MAKVQALAQHHSLDDWLDRLAADIRPLLLVLDGVTDPHNLGACLRVADGSGAHAVIAPKDHAVGISASVAKVASGAADSVPYFMVTNLARTLNELKERSIWIIGTCDDAPQTLYQADLTPACALVLGAEGTGLRQLTRKTCDILVSIPMRGAVENLNVSVASGICLYEAQRQRDSLRSLPQQLVDLLWVGLTLAGLHHLAHQSVKSLVFTSLELGHAIGVLGNHRIDDFLESGAVIQLPQTHAPDQIVHPKLQRQTTKHRTLAVRHCD